MFKNIAHKQRGVTLIEFIVAFAILSVLLTAVVTFSRSTITMNRSMVREANGVNQLKNAFNYVSRDTQMAGMVAPTDPTNLNSNHFPLTLGWITYPTDLTTVVYSLDSNGTLVRTESLNGVLRSTMTIATNVNLDPAQTNCVWDNINNKLTINIAISIGTTTEVRQFVLTPRVIQSSSQTANTISGSSTPNPAGYGDTITLTANVTPTAGSDVISSGTVTFFDGGNAIGASPLINGTASYQPISPLLSGIHTFKAVFSGDALYSSSTSSNWTQTVNKAALTITANSSSKNYGATVTFAGTEFTATGLVNGDTVTSVTLTSDGVTATATVSSSPYSIVPSVAVGTGLNNYTISYVNGSLTVNPKALTVTANSSSKTYGQTVTFLGTEFTTSALLNGDTVTSVTLTSSGASAGAAVGSYNIVPSAALGSGVNNYTISYVNGTLTVNKVALTLTITATGPSKVYGTALTAGTSTTNFTASGTITGETVTSVTLTPNAAGLSATTSVGAAYIITPSLATGTGGFLASNYNITYVPFSGTVTAKALTVTATGPSKVYGTALTTGTSTTNFTASGTITGETVTSVTLNPDAAGLSATTTAGAAYIITPSLATGTGGFLASNYNITYVPFSGTVSTKALTITANSTSKTYGATVTFAGTEFTTVGLVNGNTVTSVTLTSSGAVATAVVSGSPYNIVPSAAVGTGLTNYNISYVNGSLTVTKAASSTSLTASVSGITVTFTATVTPGTATGTVTFYDGATALGTSTVTGGVATYSTSTLSVASHSITAVYNGDGNCLTSTSSAQKLAIFIPSADSYIRQNTATTNYGTNTSLNVTYSTTADYNTLVQFNVTSLASSNIDTAYLSLYQTTAFSASVTEYNVSRSWNESQVTWNKATTTPSVNWTTAGGDITGAANSITIVSNSWNNWTVTSDVAAFITGNNYGWLLTTASTSQISFSSKEGANDPELIVLYH
jgi:prepilin-type N-terminal cleavage/methylation domain-containing protein